MGRIHRNHASIDDQHLVVGWCSWISTPASSGGFHTCRDVNLADFPDQWMQVSKQMLRRAARMAASIGGKISSPFRI